MRKKRASGPAEKLEPMQALLLALSQDLTLPLLQVKTGLESLQAQQYSKPAAREQSEKLLLVADTGLNLIEAYKLALRATADPELPVHPVAIGAVLNDVAHRVFPYAKKYSTDIEIGIRGHLSPVLAHKPSLEAALEVLSASLIRAQSSSAEQKKYKLLLGAHRNRNFISTGVFSGVTGVSDKALRVARGLVGTARNPIPAVPNGAASGILIADVLCTAMWQPLRASAYNNMHGLSTALPLSKQLHLV